MALAQQPALLNSAPLARFGALLIPPRGVARKMLTVVRSGFEDISGCISESRTHDADHDGYLLNAERLAHRGIQVSRTQGCPCAARYQALLRDIKAAQVADEREDSLIDAAWCIARRLAGAISKLFTARRSSAGAGGRRA